MKNQMKHVRLWDLPTRCFHWILIVLLGVSFYTGFSGGFREMDYHMLSGYGILGCVAFRIGWGFIGGHYSRFRTFIKGPKAIITYLGHITTKDTAYPGHNPLGAISLIAILLSLMVQGVTGLFANDDIMLEGPLTHLISYDTSRSLTSIHKSNTWIIGLLCGLHIGAILLYQFFKREKLIRAMFTGNKLLAGIEERPYSLTTEVIKGLLLLAACLGGIYLLINYV